MAHSSSAAKAARFGGLDDDDEALDQRYKKGMIKPNPLAVKVPRRQMGTRFQPYKQLGPILPDERPPLYGYKDPLRLPMVDMKIKPLRSPGEGGGGSGDVMLSGGEYGYIDDDGAAEEDSFLFVPGGTTESKPEPTPAEPIGTVADALASLVGGYAAPPPNPYTLPLDTTYLGVPKEKPRKPERPPGPYAQEPHVRDYWRRHPNGPPPEFITRHSPKLGPMLAPAGSTAAGAAAAGASRVTFSPSTLSAPEGGRMSPPRGAGGPVPTVSDPKLKAPFLGPGYGVPSGRLDDFNSAAGHPKFNDYLASGKFALLAKKFGVVAPSTPKPPPPPRPYPPPRPDLDMSTAIASNLQPYSSFFRQTCPVYVRAVVNPSPSFQVRFLLSKNRLRALPRNVLAELFQFFEEELKKVLLGQGGRQKPGLAALTNADGFEGSLASAPPDGLADHVAVPGGDADAATRRMVGMLAEGDLTGSQAVDAMQALMADGRPRAHDATGGDIGHPDASGSVTSLDSEPYFGPGVSRAAAAKAKGKGGKRRRRGGSSPSPRMKTGAAFLARQYEAMEGKGQYHDEDESDEEMEEGGVGVDDGASDATPYPPEWESDAISEVLGGRSGASSPASPRSRSLSPRHAGSQHLGDGSSTDGEGYPDPAYYSSRPGTGRSGLGSAGEDGRTSSRGRSRQGRHLGGNALGERDPYDSYDPSLNASAAGYEAFLSGETATPIQPFTVDLGPVAEERVEMESGPLAYRLLRLGVVDVETDSKTIQSATRVRHAVAYATPWSVYVDAFKGGESPDALYEAAHRGFKLYDGGPDLRPYGSDKVAAKVPRIGRDKTIFTAALQLEDGTLLPPDEPTVRVVIEAASATQRVLDGTAYPVLTESGEPDPYATGLPALQPGDEAHSLSAVAGGSKLMLTDGSVTSSHGGSRLLLTDAGATGGAAFGGSGAMVPFHGGGATAGGFSTASASYPGGGALAATAPLGLTRTGLDAPLSQGDGGLEGSGGPQSLAYLDDTDSLLKGPDGEKTALQKTLDEVNSADPFAEVIDPDKAIIDELFTSSAWYNTWSATDQQGLLRQRNIYDEIRAQDNPILEVPSAYYVSRLSVILMQRKGAGQIDLLRMAGHDGMCGCGCQGPAEDAASARFIGYTGNGWLPPDPAAAAVLVGVGDIDPIAWKPFRDKYDPYKVPDHAGPGYAAGVPVSAGMAANEEILAEAAAQEALDTAAAAAAAEAEAQEKAAAGGVYVYGVAPKPVPKKKVRLPGRAALEAALSPKNQWIFGPDGFIDKTADSARRQYKSLPDFIRGELLKSKFGSLLLPHPVLNFEKPHNEVLDLSVFAFDDKVHHVIEEAAPRIAVMRTALWQCHFLSSHHLSTLSIYAHHLRHLHIPGCKALTPGMCKVLAKATFAPTLLSLDVSMSPVLDDDGLTAFCRGFEQLRSLNLAGCNFITNLSAGHIGDHLRRLRVLDMSWCAFVDDAAIAHIVHSVDLRCLCIRGLGRGLDLIPPVIKRILPSDILKFKAMMDPAKRDLMDDVTDPEKLTWKARIIFSKTKKKNEEELEYEAKAAKSSTREQAWLANRKSLVTGKRPGEDGRWKDGDYVFEGGLTGGPLFTRTDYGKAVELLTKLVEVDMESCLGVTDEVIMSLVRSSGNVLKKLKVSHCTQITNVSTTVLACYAPALTHLHMAYCTGVVSPVIDLSYLEHLVALLGRRFPRSAYTEAVKRGRKNKRKLDRGLRNVASGIGRGAYVEQAEDDAAMAAERKFLSDAVYGDGGNIFAGDDRWNELPEFVGLHLLDISGCSGIVEEDVGWMFESLSETIRDFRLMGLHHVSGHAVVNFMHETLELARRTASKADAAETAGATVNPLLPIHKFPLQKFYVSFMPRFQDDDLMTISECCPDLRVLDVTGCPRITTAGIMHLADHCLHLREVHANDCNINITPAAVIALAQRCRLLRVLEMGRPHLETQLKLHYLQEFREELMGAQAEHQAREDRIRRRKGMAEAAAEAARREAAMPLPKKAPPPKTTQLPVGSGADPALVAAAAAAAAASAATSPAPSRGGLASQGWSSPPASRMDSRGRSRQAASRGMSRGSLGGASEDTDFIYEDDVDDDEVDRQLARAGALSEDGRSIKVTEGEHGGRSAGQGPNTPSTGRTWTAFGGRGSTPGGGGSRQRARTAGTGFGTESDASSMAGSGYDDEVEFEGPAADTEEEEADFHPQAPRSHRYRRPKPFDGDLKDLIVSVGICCPFLETLDLTGHQLPLRTGLKDAMPFNPARPLSPRTALAQGDATLSPRPVMRELKPRPGRDAAATIFAAPFVASAMKSLNLSSRENTQSDGEGGASLASSVEWTSTSVARGRRAQSSDPGSGRESLLDDEEHTPRAQTPGRNARGRVEGAKNPTEKARDFLRQSRAAIALANTKLEVIFPSLKKVVLRNASKMLPSHLVNLTAVMPELNILDVTDCQTVRTEDMQNLSRNKPYLQVISSFAFDANSNFGPNGSKRPAWEKKFGEPDSPPSSEEEGPINAEALGMEGAGERARTSSTGSMEGSLQRGSALGGSSLGGGGGGGSGVSLGPSAYASQLPPLHPKTPSKVNGERVDPTEGIPPYTPGAELPHYVRPMREHLPGKELRPHPADPYPADDQESVASDNATLRHPVPVLPKAQVHALGLIPQVAACFGREADLLINRLRLEKVALGKIEMLVTHGLKRPGRRQPIWELIERLRYRHVRHKWRAVLTIQRAIRWYQEKVRQFYYHHALVLQTFFKRLRTRNRLRRFVLAAIRMLRAAHCKQVAACMLLVAHKRFILRRTWDALRMRMTEDRWSSSLTQNRFPHLAPKFSADGGWQVQFIIPSAGHDVFGTVEERAAELERSELVMKAAFILRTVIAEEEERRQAEADRRRAQEEKRRVDAAMAAAAGAGGVRPAVAAPADTQSARVFLAAAATDAKQAVLSGAGALAQRLAGGFGEAVIAMPTSVPLPLSFNPFPRVNIYKLGAPTGRSPDARAYSKYLESLLTSMPKDAETLMRTEFDDGTTMHDEAIYDYAYAPVFIGMRIRASVLMRRPHQTAVALKKLADAEGYGGVNGGETADAGGASPAVKGRRLRAAKQPAVPTQYKRYEAPYRYAKQSAVATPHPLRQINSLDLYRKVKRVLVGDIIGADGWTAGLPVLVPNGNMTFPLQFQPVNGGFREAVRGRTRLRQARTRRAERTASPQPPPDTPLSRRYGNPIAGMRPPTPLSRGGPPAMREAAQAAAVAAARAEAKGDDSDAASIGEGGSASMASLAYGAQDSLASLPRMNSTMLSQGDSVLAGPSLVSEGGSMASTSTGGISFGPFKAAIGMTGSMHTIAEGSTTEQGSVTGSQDTGGSQDGRGGPPPGWTPSLYSEARGPFAESIRAFATAGLRNNPHTHVARTARNLAYYEAEAPPPRAPPVPQQSMASSMPTVVSDQSSDAPRAATNAGLNRDAALGNFARFCTGLQPLELQLRARRDFYLFKFARLHVMAVRAKGQLDEARNVLSEAVRLDQEEIKMAKLQAASLPRSLQSVTQLIEDGDGGGGSPVGSPKASQVRSGPSFAGGLRLSPSMNASKAAGSQAGGGTGGPWIDDGGDSDDSEGGAGPLPASSMGSLGAGSARVLPVNSTATSGSSRFDNAKRTLTEALESGVLTGTEMSRAMQFLSEAEARELKRQQRIGAIRELVVKAANLDREHSILAAAADEALALYRSAEKTWTRLRRKHNFHREALAIASLFSPSTLVYSRFKSRFRAVDRLGRPLPPSAAPANDNGLEALASIILGEEAAAAAAAGGSGEYDEMPLAAGGSIVTADSLLAGPTNGGQFSSIVGFAGAGVAVMGSFVTQKQLARRDQLSTVLARPPSPTSFPVLPQSMVIGIADCATDAVALPARDPDALDLSYATLFKKDADAHKVRFSTLPLAGMFSARDPLVEGQHKKQATLTNGMSAGAIVKLNTDPTAKRAYEPLQAHLPQQEREDRFSRDITTNLMMDLAKTMRPVENLTAILGPVIVVRRVRMELNIQLPSYFIEKRKLKDTQEALERAAQRRLRRGLAGRIVRAYRAYYNMRKSAEAMKAYSDAQTAAYRAYWSRYGYHEPPHCDISVPDAQYHAAVVIQRYFRGFSARLTILRLRRAACVAKAKDLLKHLGLALDGCDRDPISFIRAQALAVEIHGSLMNERDTNTRMRRLSLAFNRAEGEAGRARAAAEADVIINKLSEAIRAEAGPAFLSTLELPVEDLNDALITSRRALEAVGGEGWGAGSSLDLPGANVFGLTVPGEATYRSFRLEAAPGSGKPSSGGAGRPLSTNRGLPPMMAELASTSSLQLAPVPAASRVPASVPPLALASPSSASLPSQSLQSPAGSVAAPKELSVKASRALANVFAAFGSRSMSFPSVETNTLPDTASLPGTEGYDSDGAANNFGPVLSDGLSPRGTLQRIRSRAVGAEALLMQGQPSYRRTTRPLPSKMRPLAAVYEELKRILMEEADMEAAKERSRSRSRTRRTLEGTGRASSTPRLGRTLSGRGRGGPRTRSAARSASREPQEGGGGTGSAGPSSAGATRAGAAYYAEFVSDPGLRGYEGGEGWVLDGGAVDADARSLMGRSALRLRTRPSGGLSDIGDGETTARTSATSANSEGDGADTDAQTRDGMDESGSETTRTKGDATELDDESVAGPLFLGDKKGEDDGASERKDTEADTAPSRTGADAASDGGDSRAHTVTEADFFGSPTSLPGTTRSTVPAGAAGTGLKPAGTTAETSASGRDFLYTATNRSIMPKDPMASFMIGSGASFASGTGGLGASFGASFGGSFAAGASKANLLASSANLNVSSDGKSGGEDDDEGGGAGASAAGTGRSLFGKALGNLTGRAKREKEEAERAAAAAAAARAKKQMDLVMRLHNIDQLRARYYAGTMSLEELLAYRRALDNGAFLHRIHLQLCRSVSLEGSTFRLVAEQMCAWVEDRKQRFNEVAVGVKNWKKHWSLVLRSMIERLQNSIDASDPYIELSRTRTAVRIALLQQKLIQMSTREHASREALIDLERLSAWCKVAAGSLLRRFKKDGDLLNRLRAHIPAARRVLQFIDRRRVLLTQKYEKLVEEGRAAAAAEKDGGGASAGGDASVQRRAAVMGKAMGSGALDSALPASFGMYTPDAYGKPRQAKSESAAVRAARHRIMDSTRLIQGAGGAALSARAGTDDTFDDSASMASRSSRRDRGGAGGDNRSVASGGSAGGGSLSGGGALRKGASFRAPGDAPAPASGLGPDGKPIYDWRATDEWIIRETRLGRKVFIHLPSGTTLTKEPIAPPAGYSYPPAPAQASGRGRMLSPTLVPTRDMDQPVAPPMLSPSRFPSRAPGAFAGGDTGAGILDDGIPRALRLDEKKVFAVLTDAERKSRPQKEAGKGGRSKSASATPSKGGSGAASVSGRSEASDGRSGPAGTAASDGMYGALRTNGTTSRIRAALGSGNKGDAEQFAIDSAADAVNELMGTLPDEVAAPTRTKKQRAEAAAKAAARRKLQMDHVRSELRWLTNEEQLLLDCINRMEAYLATLARQREERAREQINKVVSIRKMADEALDGYEKLFKYQNELMQVRSEKIMSSYIAQNKTVQGLDTAHYRESYPRFGRIFAEPETQRARVDPCFLTALLPEVQGAPDDVNYDPHCVVAMTPRVPLHVSEIERRRLLRLQRAAFQRMLLRAFSEARCGFITGEMELFLTDLQSPEGRRKYGYTPSVVGGAISLANRTVDGGRGEGSLLGGSTFSYASDGFHGNGVNLAPSLEAPHAGSVAASSNLGFQPSWLPGGGAGVHTGPGTVVEQPSDRLRPTPSGVYGGPITPQASQSGAIVPVRSFGGVPGRGGGGGGGGAGGAPSGADRGPAVLMGRSRFSNNTGPAFLTVGRAPAMLYSGLNRQEPSLEGALQLAERSVNSVGSEVFPRLLAVPKNIERQRQKVILQIGARGCVSGELLEDASVRWRAAGIPAPRWLLKQFKTNHADFIPTPESIAGNAAIKAIQHLHTKPGRRTQHRGFHASEWYVPKPHRAEVAPTPENLAYYSIGGAGEEIGNPGFYYWGPDDGTIVGLFGIRMRFGTYSSANAAAANRAAAERVMRELAAGKGVTGGGGAAATPANEGQKALRSILKSTAVPGLNAASLDSVEGDGGPDGDAGAGAAGDRAKTLRPPPPPASLPLPALEAALAEVDAAEKQSTGIMGPGLPPLDPVTRAAHAAALAKVQAEIAEDTLVGGLQMAVRPLPNNMPPSLHDNTALEEADELALPEDGPLRLAFEGRIVVPEEVVRRLQTLRLEAIKARRTAASKGLATARVAKKTLREGGGGASSVLSGSIPGVTGPLPGGGAGGSAGGTRASRRRARSSGSSRPGTGSSTNMRRAASRRHLAGEASVTSVEPGAGATPGLESGAGSLAGSSALLARSPSPQSRNPPTPGGGTGLVASSERSVVSPQLAPVSPPPAPDALRSPVLSSPEGKAPDEGGVAPGSPDGGYDSLDGDLAGRTGTVGPMDSKFEDEEAAFDPRRPRRHGGDSINGSAVFGAHGRGAGSESKGGEDEGGEGGGRGSGGGSVPALPLPPAPAGGDDDDADALPPVPASALMNASQVLDIKTLQSSLTLAPKAGGTKPGAPAGTPATSTTRTGQSLSSSRWNLAASTGGQSSAKSGGKGGVGPGGAGVGIGADEPRDPSRRGSSALYTAITAPGALKGLGKTTKGSAIDAAISIASLARTENSSVQSVIDTITPQHERDSRDTPGWWRSVGVKDEETAIMRDPSLLKTRGFAGGISYAGSAEDYQSNLIGQEVALLTTIRNAIVRRQFVEKKMEEAMDELQRELAKPAPLQPPRVVKDIIESSIAATDELLLKRWAARLEHKLEKKGEAEEERKRLEALERRKKKKEGIKAALGPQEKTTKGGFTPTGSDNESRGSRTRSDDSADSRTMSDDTWDTDMSDPIKDGRRADAEKIIEKSKEKRRKLKQRRGSATSVMSSESSEADTDDISITKPEGSGAGASSDEDGEEGAGSGTDASRNRLGDGTDVDTDGEPSLPTLAKGDDTARRLRDLRNRLRALASIRGRDRSDAALLDSVKTDGKTGVIASNVEGVSDWRSGGFRGVVAPDGSLLEWAGDGAEFRLQAWKNRYRLRPWVVDAALFKLLRAKQKDDDGSGPLDDDTLWKELIAESATVLLREYKQAGKPLPMSGFEVLKQRVTERREAIAAEAAARAAEAEALAALEKEGKKQDLLSRINRFSNKLKAKYKAAKERRARGKSLVQQIRDLPTTVKDSIEDLKRQTKEAMNMTKGIYFAARKAMLERKLRRDKGIQGAIGVIQRRQLQALDLPLGVGEITFTAGHAHCVNFAAAQRRAFDKTRPFFLRAEGNLGSDDMPVYIWYRLTHELDKMIHEFRWGPAPTHPDQDMKDHAERLASKGFTLHKDDVVFQDWGLWYAVQLPGGRPIVSMACCEATKAWTLETQGYAAIGGNLVSEQIVPNRAIMYKAPLDTKRRNVQGFGDVVRNTEIKCLEDKADYLGRRVKKLHADVKAAAMKRGGKPVRSNVTAMAEYEYKQAKKTLIQRRKAVAAEKEEAMAVAAVDFLGLKQGEVRVLKQAFNAMDVKRKGYVHLRDFWPAVGVRNIGERSPMHDAFFYFLDHAFKDKLTFGGFLRTVCSFCMFGPSELITFVFAAVANGHVFKAERTVAEFKDRQYQPGMPGFDRVANKPVRWEDCLRWNDLPPCPDKGTISLIQFRHIIYNIHSPTSAIAGSIKAALKRCELAAVRGCLTSSTYRKLCEEFPALMQPMFQLQSRVRQRFLGESWWGKKRQLFADARDILREQHTAAVRIAQLREEDAGEDEGIDAIRAYLDRTETTGTTGTGLTSGSEADSDGGGSAPGSRRGSVAEPRGRSRRGGGDGGGDGGDAGGGATRVSTGGAAGSDAPPSDYGYDDRVPTVASDRSGIAGGVGEATLDSGSDTAGSDPYKVPSRYVSRR